MLVQSRYNPVTDADFGSKSLQLFFVGINADFWILAIATAIVIIQPLISMLQDLNSFLRK
jgi:hypothetical protein